MEGLLTSSNIVAFSSGLLAGILVGVVIGIYFGINYRNELHPVLLSNIFGAVVAILWASLHTFSILSGTLEIPFIFDVVGGLAMGQTLGIDLVSALSKIRK